MICVAVFPLLDRRQFLFLFIPYDVGETNGGEEGGGGGEILINQVAAEEGKEGGGTCRTTLCVCVCVPPIATDCNRKSER